MRDHQRGPLQNLQSGSKAHHQRIAGQLSQSLGQELRVPLTTIQWVVTGYLLALALMLPLSGWLVDRVGAKQLYLGCFAAFTCASLLCGVSTTAATLIGSRILQGMAGGLLVRRWRR
jgi:MFS family permease